MNQTTNKTECKEWRGEYTHLKQQQDELALALKEVRKGASSQAVQELYKKVKQWQDEVRLLDEQFRVSLERAIGILGEENVIGPKDLKDVWGYQIDLPIPPSLTEQDLIKMKEMGHKLVLRYDKDNNGNPLTMREMNKHYSSLGGKLLYDTDWYKNESFFTSETSKLGWYEVSTEPIPDTGDKDYFEQTKLIAEYVKKRFKGQKMPDEYITAITELGALASSTVMEELIKNDWEESTEQLAKLQINQLFRRSASQIIQDLINRHKKNGICCVLESFSDWTSTRSLDGNLVLVGFAGADGADVGKWSPDDGDGAIRAFFSRRL